MNQGTPDQTGSVESEFHFRWRPPDESEQASARIVGNQEQAVPGVQFDPPTPHAAFKAGGRGGIDQRESWAYRTASLNSRDGLPNGVQEKIVLFNVVVALAWEPDAAYLQSLQEASIKASALLYDVTDGYMAIEQIVIVGAEELPFADVQIFPSNRFLPRSQVSGLLDEERFLPIRLGRGLWDKRKHVLTEWAKTPGVLVHEWGHYALGLKDQYLERVTTIANGAPAELVVPAIGLLADSIMAGVEQSELTGNVLHLTAPTRDELPEWAQLAERYQYNRHLGINRKHKPRPEPPPLAPVPIFHDLRKASTTKAAPPTPTSAFPPDHCWVYLLRNGDYLIQQGILNIDIDATDGTSYLSLFGAIEGDEGLFLYSQDAIGRVKRGPLGTHTGPWAEHTEPWQDVTPSGAWPMVAVTYVGDEAGKPLRYGQEAHVSVQILADRMPSGVSISPLGHGAAVWPGSAGTFAVPNLDGAVMATWGTGEDQALLVAHFSQGGSPNSGYPAHPNPIPSGSGEGNALIFFHDETVEVGKPGKKDRSNYRIVTTTNYHVPAPDGAESRSYVFGVTTNLPLKGVDDLRPTLILAFDDAKELVELHLCRYAGKDQGWVPLPDSTLFNDRSFVAASLNVRTAPGLFADPPYPEFFRLLGTKASPAR